VGPLVCSSKLLSPFLIANGRSSHCKALRRILALGVLAVKVVVHLHYLLSASDDIVRKTNTVQTSENLVLTRHVQLG
jgi:hypothetical protein